jgi:epoxyqueuosine reductase
VKRIGRGRFVRNVVIAVGNSGARTLAAEAARLLGDADPQVRGAAVWALSRLLPADMLQAMAAERLAAESEADVLAEWRGALRDQA